jgi:glucose/arabinose dehydrogenase
MDPTFKPVQRSSRKSPAANSSLFRPKLMACAVALALTGIAHGAWAQTAANPVCPEETAFFNPGNGEDIVLPQGYRVQVFAKGLNFPTDIAFISEGNNFRVVALESGTGLPSPCNDNTKVPGMDKFDPRNPFTPNLRIFDQNGNQIAGPLAKPTAAGGGFQPDGPAVGLAFENGTAGGTLFASDSNQAVSSPGGGNNSSRITTVNMTTGQVNPLITGLPTGDHPTEQIVVNGGFLYWSQGSATNSGVVGHDNGGGANQHDIPCQDITLSDALFDSGDGHMTSGYSNHGVRRPGATVPAFEGATHKGMCTGAILRASIADPMNTIEPVAWGFRNPFGLRFSPAGHPLKGELLISENGEDERGARPTNNAPDRLAIARKNANGTPEYHGWPDRFGFLDSTQAVFDPVGGPSDDLFPNIDAIKKQDIPVRHVLAFPPQTPIAPLALQPADSAAVGLDFAPESFLHGVVKQNAVLMGREGDFGFSPENGSPSEGHDIELVNFTDPNNPNEISLTRFAFNCPQGSQGHAPDGSATCSTDTDQAFSANLRGINRPLTVRFGPDGALYLVDYGAVRDAGAGGPASKFVNPADATLVQIPGTGVIWRITRDGS